MWYNENENIFQEGVAFFTLKKKPLIVVLFIILTIIAIIAGYRAYQSYAWEKCCEEYWMPHIGDPSRFHVVHDEGTGETIYTTLPDDDELLFGFSMVIPTKGCYPCKCFATSSLCFDDDTAGGNETDGGVCVGKPGSNDYYDCDMYASVDREGKIVYYHFTLQEPTKEGNWEIAARLDLTLVDDSMLSAKEEAVYRDMLPTMKHCIEKINSIFQF